MDTRKLDKWISKLNDVTGKYEPQESPFQVPDLQYKKNLYRMYEVWDYRLFTMLDYPDRIETIVLDKSKEINADFEVIKEKPETKLLTEGKQI